MFAEMCDECIFGFAPNASFLPNFILAELAEIGVRRVSIGAGLYRIAMAAARDAASEMKDGGFTFVNDMIRVRDLRSAFGEF